MSLKIKQIPVLDDNYIYLLQDQKTGKTAVVDPALADPVVRELDQMNCRLDYILNTHHHFDHVGGNRELCQRYACQVVGPKNDRDRIPEISIELQDGDLFLLGEAEAEVFDTPGHTRGHIVYHFAQDQALFCGDTLFSLGCGRLFEGTPEQMWNSLEKIRRLPDATLIYCAHEYTLANAHFARSVDPDNAALETYFEEIQKARQEDRPTIPAQLGREKSCNPFLRAHEPELQASVQASETIATFAEVRRRKDRF